MFISRIKELNRRAFLKRSAQLAAVGAAAPLAMNLAAAGEAAAFSATDYKALVCVFLAGGNDQSNTLIPYDTTNYDLYSTIRGGGANRTQGGIAIARADLANTVLNNGQALTDGIQYALAPQLGRMAGLFRSGNLAVQLNAGPLMTPLTRAQYDGGNRASYPLPPHLFSHNDQQSFWQSLAIEGSTEGWGGRIGDLAMSSNGQSALTCVSAAGNAVFLSGKYARQYHVEPTGAVSINGINNRYFGSDATVSALRTLLTQSYGRAMEEQYAAVCRRSINMHGVVGSALNQATVNTAFNASNPLAAQLKIVARMIAARKTLGMKRQVFFVQMGGFDTHDYLMRDHPGLLAKLDEAMASFHAATVEMGIADNVTTFTASDFGRGLASNGDGSDHGWGGHHFIMGGAVKGGRFYGTAPHVSLISDDQVGHGRLLPTTSVDQIASTMALWFGVPAGDLTTVLPRITNFNAANLGFVA